MLKRAKGNLIDMAEAGEFDFIVQGCNCHNTMGSGIAKEIRERYPIAYEADTKAAEIWVTPVARLGNFSFAVTDKNFVIINAYTQVDFMPRGVDHFEYEAFYIILKKLETLAGEGVRFGFPYIGMGLAGGNPLRIVVLLENFAAKVSAKGGSVTLVEFG
jgi:O-acetyl-ADP-ribose deacetylase (regulator of RNase III)